jgi:hypothetical protein
MGTHLNASKVGFVISLITFFEYIQSDIKIDSA